MLFPSPAVSVAGFSWRETPPAVTVAHRAAGHEPRIAMITNPRSGGNRKGLSGIRSFLADHPHIRHGEAVTPDQVRAALAEFASCEIDLLVVNGGDGTVQSVLTTLYGQAPGRRPPLLALLRAGTTSMLARDVGVAGRPLAALAKIQNWSSATPDGRRIEERPILRVRQGADGQALCGMFFGAGAIPRGIELFHGRVNPKGVRGEFFPGVILARLLLAAFRGNENCLPPADMTIHVDGAPVRETRYLFALVSTLERLFLGMHPYWGKEPAPLHFSAVRSKPPGLPRALPFLLRGRTTRTVTPENGYFSHNARRITLDFRGRFTLDGELFDAVAPLTIEPAGPARFLKL
jgi:hypothetical protein